MRTLNIVAGLAAIGLLLVVWTLASDFHPVTRHIAGRHVDDAMQASATVLAAIIAALVAANMVVRQLKQEHDAEEARHDASLRLQLIQNRDLANVQSRLENLNLPLGYELVELLKLVNRSKRPSTEDGASLPDPVVGNLEAAIKAAGEAVNIFGANPSDAANRVFFTADQCRLKAAAYHDLQQRLDEYVNYLEAACQMFCDLGRPLGPDPSTRHGAWAYYARRLDESDDVSAYVRNPDYEWRELVLFLNWLDADRAACWAKKNRAQACRWLNMYPNGAWRNRWKASLNERARR